MLNGQSAGFDLHATFPHSGLPHISVYEVGTDKKLCPSVSVSQGTGTFVVNPLDRQNIKSACPLRTEYIITEFLKEVLKQYLILHPPPPKPTVVLSGPSINSPLSKSGPLGVALKNPLFRRFQEPSLRPRVPRLGRLQNGGPQNKGLSTADLSSDC